MSCVIHQFCLEEAWEGVDHEANTKTRGSKYKMTYVHPHTHIYTNGVLEHKYQASLPRLHKTTVLLYNILGKSIVDP